MQSESCVVVSRTLLSQIRAILKSNPKGFSVTDIAHRLRMNRNLVSKYLDILSLSGQIEMRTYGPAKVFFPSRRVPLGVMLNYTAEYILVLDRHLVIIQINNRLADLIGQPSEELLGRTIDQIDHPILNDAALREALPSVMAQYEQSADLVQELYWDHRSYRVRLISTVFDDGSPGITCIIENVTDRNGAGQKDLRESNNPFREIVGLSPTPIAIVDREGRHLYVNAQFSEVFGYSLDEIRAWEDWIRLAFPDPDYQKYIQEIWNREIFGGDCLRSPRLFHIRASNGEMKKALVTGRCLSNNSFYLDYQDICDLNRVMPPAPAIPERKKCPAVAEAWTDRGIDVPRLYQT